MILQKGVALFRRQRFDAVKVEVVNPQKVKLLSVSYVDKTVKQYCMRKAGIFIAITTLLFIFSRDTPATLSGKVVGVSDGDTIIMLIDQQQEKIRLEGIDCPEKRQVFGKKAKQFTSDMVYGKTVSLKRTGNDRYGRTLGVIQVQGKVLNQELVKAGYAWHFKKYSSSSVLSLLEEEARNERKGAMG